MKALFSIFLATCLVTLISGCASQPPISQDFMTSNGYTIDDEALSTHRKAIVIDELENRFYFTGGDYEHWLLPPSYRLIVFTHHPDSDQGTVFVDVRNMQRDWVNSSSVTIYIGKEKLVEKWSDGRYTDTSIVDGGYGSSVYTHEHYVIPLDIENAEKLANAPPKTITLRFYGPQGYVDEKLHLGANMRGLQAVVELAKATRKIDI